MVAGHVVSNYFGAERTRRWDNSSRFGNRGGHQLAEKHVERKMSDVRILVKGSINRAAENDFATLLQYHFQITPLAQTLDGRDRTFTFSHYTSTVDRDKPKHSKERKRIAAALRTKHKFIWNLFRQTMSIEGAE